MTDLSETLEGQTWLDMECLEQVLKVHIYKLFTRKPCFAILFIMLSDDICIKMIAI